MTAKTKILFIDDESELLELLGEYFADHGFEAVLANGGGEGLKQFRANSDVALVVCDVSMPKLKGLEVIKKIRMLSEKVPFVFFTGFGSRDTMLEASKYGAYDFVRKPDIAGLLQVVEQAIAVSRGEKVNGTHEDPLSEYQRLLAQR
ncbi:MAG: response regulator [Bacteriovoracaceae bacterium]|nr:response regulator [Bacteriovoracaceae bacterium]